MPFLLFAPKNVRQHALSMLTDCFLDKRGNAAPTSHLCNALVVVCIPLTGRRIEELRIGNARVDSIDELMIEFELCIKLIFKPFRHHLARVQDENGDVLALWKALLAVLENFLRDEKVTTPANSPNGDKPVSDDLARTMNELANEHLQNAIMFLISKGLITDSDANSPGDLTAATWESVERMGFCKSFVGEWKEAAKSPAAKEG